MSASIRFRLVRFRCDRFRLVRHLKTVTPVLFTLVPNSYSLDIL